MASLAALGTTILSWIVKKPRFGTKANSSQILRYFLAGSKFSLVIHTIHLSSCKNKLSFMGNGFSFTSKQTRNELRICCSIEEIFVLEQIGANTNPGIFENLLMKIIDEKQEQDSGDDIMGKAPLLIV